jgi:hypothetical protein
VSDDLPDHSLALREVLDRKAEGRRKLAKRSFGEKIATMEELRERLAPMKRAGEYPARCAGAARQRVAV